MGNKSVASGAGTEMRRLQVTEMETDVYLTGPANSEYQDFSSLGRGCANFDLGIGLREGAYHYFTCLLF